MQIVIPLVVLLFSAILHEVMHGLVADKLGDPTARHMGRLTLNPIPHLDPLMSIILPGILLLSGSPIIFGAAKPVPVNPLNFRDPKKDMALTALAGPLTNIFLAIVGAQLFRLVSNNDVLTPIFFAIVVYNLILAVINLIPIPPLDGSKVLAIILPDDIASQYLSIERYGIIILLFLLVFPIGPFSLGQVVNNLILWSLHILGV